MFIYVTFVLRCAALVISKMSLVKMDFYRAVYILFRYLFIRMGQSIYIKILNIIY